MTTIACGAHIDWRLLSVAYDPTSRSLVLCTCSAVYRLPVEGLGAAAPKTVHQLELVAGAEGEDGHLDGVGALFNHIWAVAVDGTGTAWVLDYLAKHPSDEQPDSSAQGGPGRSREVPGCGVWTPTAAPRRRPRGRWRGTRTSTTVSPYCGVATWRWRRLPHGQSCCCSWA